MRIPPKPQAEPGKWMTDEHGRRFRMIGNCKEYEREINGIPQSVFFASQKQQKDLDAKRYEEEKRQAAQRRNCPFKDGMHTDCIREACALFLDGCTLARLTPAKDTEGLQCPISRYNKCRKDCALYNSGCTLTGISMNTEREDKKNE